MYTFRGHIATCENEFCTMWVSGHQVCKHLSHWPEIIRTCKICCQSWMEIKRYILIFDLHLTALYACDASKDKFLKMHDPYNYGRDGVEFKA